MSTGDSLNSLYQKIKTSKLNSNEKDTIINNLASCNMKLRDYTIQQLGLTSQGSSLIFLLTNGTMRVIMKIYYYAKDDEFNSPSNHNNSEIYIYEKLFQNRDTLKNMIITIYSNHIKCKQLPVKIIQYINKNPDNNKLQTVRSIQSIPSPSAKFKIMFFEYGNLTMETFITHYNNEIDNVMMQILLFQISYTLYLLDKDLLFKHNDLHLDNIIIDIDPNYDPGKTLYYQYTIDNRSYYVPVIPFVAKLYDFDRSYICTIFKDKFEINEIRPLKGVIRDFWILFGLIISIDKSYDIFNKISEVLSSKLGNTNKLADYRKLFSTRVILENYSILYDNILSYNELIYNIFYDTFSKEQIHTIIVPDVLNNSCTSLDIRYFNQLTINEMAGKLNQLLKTYNQPTYNDIKNNYDFKHDYNECIPFTNTKDVTSIEDMIKFKIGNTNCVNDLNTNLLHLRYIYAITKIITSPNVFPHPKKYNLDDTYNIMTIIQKCQDNLVCLRATLPKSDVETYNGNVVTKFIDANNNSIVNFIIGMLNIVSKSDDIIAKFIDDLDTSDNDYLLWYDFLDSLKYSRIITYLETYIARLKGGRRPIKYKFLKLF